MAGRYSHLPLLFYPVKTPYTIINIQPMLFHNLALLMDNYTRDINMPISKKQLIANCLWRSRRAITAVHPDVQDRKTARINRQLNNIHRDLHLTNLYKNLRGESPENGEDREKPREDENRTRDDLIRMRSIPDISYSFNILRYEMRLDRQLYRAYRLLRHHKSQNQSGEKTKNAMGPPK